MCNFPFYGTCIDSLLSGFQIGYVKLVNMDKRREEWITVERFRTELNVESNCEAKGLKIVNNRGNVKSIDEHSCA